MKSKTFNSHSRHGPILNQQMAGNPKLSLKQLQALEKINSIINDSLENDSNEFSSAEKKFLRKCKFIMPTEHEALLPEVDKSTISVSVLQNGITVKIPSVLQVIAVVSYAITECILHKLGFH